MSVRKFRPKKQGAYTLAEPVSSGTILSDAHKRKWIVGSPIGKGGFGCIYATLLDGNHQDKFVAKIEPQQNGPLFTEIHFYIRGCSQDSISKWMAQHRLKFLGVPRYVSSGLFSPPGGSPCRFLIMDRFSADFESALKSGKLKVITVLRATINVLNALEYLHSKDYAHADIKASNLLYKDQYEQVTLVDFGLVHLFRIGGKHCPQKADAKFKHNGTLEFCSRDAHAGLPPARRGDLEILLYNLIHWIARCRPDAAQSHSVGLPWGHLISDPVLRQNVPDRVKLEVASFKEKSMENVNDLFKLCGLSPYSELLNFAKEIKRLSYDETPNYQKLHQYLTSVCEQVISNHGARRVGVTGKRSSTESQLTPNDIQNAEQPPEKCSTPVTPKRPRGRPPAKSKSNKDVINTTPSSSTITKKSSKAGTGSGSSRKVGGRTEVGSPKSALLPATHSRTRIGSPKSPIWSSPVASNQSHRTATPGSLRELFPEDKLKEVKDVHRAARKHNPPIIPKPSGRKVLTPLNPPVEQKPTTTLSSSSTRRKSGFCQTSPELLMVARAEALGQRAAELRHHCFTSQ